MSAIAPLVAGHSFEFAIPGADLHIQLNPGMIGPLGAAVMEGFKLVPRRGLEVGGLLLGRVESGRVMVEEFEDVPSEHQRGPSWLLSEKDKRILADAVARANSAEKATRVVGLYRSQTRAGFAPAEEDVALMKEYCGASSPAFLLIKPEAAGLSTALFAAGEGLQARSEVFPFRPQPGALPAPRPAAPAPPAAPRSAEPSVTPLPRLQTARVLEGFVADRNLALKPPPERRLARPPVWIMGILLCAAAGGYGLAKWRTDPPPRAQAASPLPESLSLHATLSGASLEINWDRNASPIRRANGGVLWIDDGPHHRRLDLGLDELRQGSIQYWPKSSDVAFKLDVFTPESTATASVRAVSWRSGATER